MSTPHQRSSPASSNSAKRKGKTVASPAVSFQTPAPRPAADDRDGWRAHWQAQGQPWRTEPEIDAQRQERLTNCRAIVPDIEKGIYPFKEMKLSRADVEWLLATHENGRGPVDWDDMSQRTRLGLDLRGADLSDTDLRLLPLARLRGGLMGEEWMSATSEQRSMAAIRFERTRLSSAHWEGSILTHAKLGGSHLNGTHLESVDAFDAHFEASVPTSMRGVYFDISTKLDQASLANDKHVGARLLDVRWGGANLTRIDWSSVQTLSYVQYAQDRLREQRDATWAYNQLSLELRQQGIYEDASRFVYLAQVHQRHVSFLQMTQHGKTLKQRASPLRAWLFSWFLLLIAGYGYKPGRSFLAYLLVISRFATAYYFLGYTIGPSLSPLGVPTFFPGVFPAKQKGKEKRTGASEKRT